MRAVRMLHFAPGYPTAADFKRLSRQIIDHIVLCLPYLASSGGISNMHRTGMPTAYPWTVPVAKFKVPQTLWQKLSPAVVAQIQSETKAFYTSVTTHKEQFLHEQLQQASLHSAVPHPLIWSSANDGTTSASQSTSTYEPSPQLPMPQTTMERNIPLASSSVDELPQLEWLELDSFNFFNTPHEESGVTDAIVSQTEQWVMRSRAQSLASLQSGPSYSTPGERPQMSAAKLQRIVVQNEYMLTEVAGLMPFNEMPDEDQEILYLGRLNTVRSLVRNCEAIQAILRIQRPVEPGFPQQTLDKMLDHSNTIKDAADIRWKELNVFFTKQDSEMQEFLNDTEPFPESQISPVSGIQQSEELVQMRERGRSSLKVYSDRLATESANGSVTSESASISQLHGLGITAQSSDVRSALSGGHPAVMPPPCPSHSKGKGRPP